MNGINSKDRFSFAKGYRARTIFLIFDILLLGILMCMMVLPLLKVIVDSIDPHQLRRAPVAPQDRFFGL